MTPHPHAEILRAIADGVPLSEFEAKSIVHPDQWSPLEARAYWVIYPIEYEIRRKPQFIMVNGFKVPKPLEWDGNLMYVYVPRPDNRRYFDAYDEAGCRRVIELSIAHTTKEAAIAHAKAMLGIDPQYFKE